MSQEALGFGSQRAVAGDVVLEVRRPGVGAVELDQPCHAVLTRAVAFAPGDAQHLEPVG
jgi:hypothetical protein